MATERQKKTLENLGSSKSLGEAMRKAGYSDSYADNPDQLKKKKSWQELLDKDVPESYVSKKLKELSQAVVLDKLVLASSLGEKDVQRAMRAMNVSKSKYIAVRVKGVGWEVYYPKPDYTNRNSAVEKIIKARGGYAPDKIAFTDTEGRFLEDDDLDKQIELLEKELRVNYLKKAKKKKNEPRQSGDKKKTTSSEKGEAKKT